MIKASASHAASTEPFAAQKHTGAPVHGAAGLPGAFVAHPFVMSSVTVAAALSLCALCAALFDAPLARYAFDRPASVHQLALWISTLGLSGYMLVGSAAVGLCALVLSRRDKRRAVQDGLNLLAGRALFIFVAIAVSGVIVQVLKHLVGRARPKLIDQWGAFHFDLFSIKASLASFPSGHATSIFALAAALGLLVPRVRWPLALLALLVSASRVLVGSHYLSDVIAGAALGSLVTSTLAIGFAKWGIVFIRVRDTLSLIGWGRVAPAISILAQRSRTAP